MHIFANNSIPLLSEAYKIHKNINLKITRSNNKT